MLFQHPCMSQAGRPRASSESSVRSSLSILLTSVFGIVISLNYDNKYVSAPKLGRFPLPWQGAGEGYGFSLVGHGGIHWTHPAP